MLSETKILESLTVVKDPELGLDVGALGLIYKVRILETKVKILMTLTFPGCPWGPELVEKVKKAVGKVSEGREVDVKVTFDPPWDLKMMSSESKLFLGISN